MEKFDFLTKLWSFETLKKAYHSYYKKNHNSYLVAIDFAKLKSINDNFGHAIGDICLRSFSDILREFFPNDILVRRSGDEFIIVSSLTYEELKNKIECIPERIVELHEEKEIPTIYGFNSGIKECEEDFDKTLLLADITMYKAKGEQLLHLHYTDQIYDSFRKNDEFLTSIDAICEQREFNFVFQKLHKSKEEETEILEIYARGLEEQSLFELNKRKIIHSNYRFRKLDLTNLQVLFKCYGHYFLRHSMIINLHYHTILFKQYDFSIFLNELLEMYKIPRDHIILSISILDFDGKISELEDMIRKLNDMSIAVCLDNLDLSTSHLVLSLINRVSISYVKISNRLLKESLDGNVANNIFKSLIYLFDSLKIAPIFISVENEREYEQIMSLEINNLMKGRYLSSEEKMEKWQN